MESIRSLYAQIRAEVSVKRTQNMKKFKKILFFSRFSLDRSPTACYINALDTQKMHTDCALMCQEID